MDSPAPFPCPPQPGQIPEEEPRRWVRPRPARSSFRHPQRATRGPLGVATPSPPRSPSFFESILSEAPAGGRRGPAAPAETGSACPEGGRLPPPRTSSPPRGSVSKATERANLETCVRGGGCCDARCARRIPASLRPSPPRTSWAGGAARQTGVLLPRSLRRWGGRRGGSLPSAAGPPPPPGHVPSAHETAATVKPLGQSGDPAPFTSGHAQPPWPHPLTAGPLSVAPERAVGGGN